MGGWGMEIKEELDYFSHISVMQMAQSIRDFSLGFQQKKNYQHISQPEQPKQLGGFVFCT